MLRYTGGVKRRREPPAGITLTGERRGPLTIRSPASDRGSAIVFLVVVAAFVAFLAFMLDAASVERPVPIALAVWSPLVYLALALGINVRRIDLANGVLTMSEGPLPRTFRRTIRVGPEQTFEIESRRDAPGPPRAFDSDIGPAVHGHRVSRGASASFDLRTNGELVLKFDTYEQADFVAYTLARALRPPKKTSA